MLAQGLRMKGTTYPSTPITTPAILTGSDRFPAQVIGSRVGMAKGMNHYLQNDSQQGMLSRMEMLSYLLLCPDTRTGVLGKTAGLQSMQKPKVKSKGQGVRNQEEAERGRWDRHGKKT